MHTNDVQREQLSSYTITLVVCALISKAAQMLFSDIPLGSSKKSKRNIQWVITR
jgi:hypothetical protein